MVIQLVSEHSTNKMGPSPPSLAPFISDCTLLWVYSFSARLSTSLVAFFQSILFFPFCPLINNDYSEGSCRVANKAAKTSSSTFPGIRKRERVKSNGCL